MLSSYFFSILTIISTYGILGNMSFTLYFHLILIIYHKTTPSPVNSTGQPWLNIFNLPFLLSLNFLCYFSPIITTTSKPTALNLCICFSAFSLFPSHVHSKEYFLIKNQLQTAMNHPLCPS